MLDRTLGMLLKANGEPVDDGSQDGSGSVSEDESVVTGGQPAPLIHLAVAMIDDVATAVGLGIQGDGPATSNEATTRVGSSWA